MMQAADILIRNAVIDQVLLLSFFANNTQSNNEFNRAGQVIESALLVGAVLTLKLPFLGEVRYG